MILPDVLASGLKVVFCGTAAGARSAQLGAYYAGPGNRFYETLYRVGLTPRRLQPSDFMLLPTFGIGLTDVAKHTSGGDKTLRPEHFDALSVRDKIEQFAPLAFAFNGKRAAQEFYGVKVNYGVQPIPIGRTMLFVLPSTSGAARGFWDEHYWQALADWLQGQKQR